MRLLLDSHILVWAILQPERMTSALERTLADQRNERYVSTATIWELGLKQGREKITLPPDLTTDLEEINAEALDVTMEHAVATTKLPFLHADPFDRMLIAQAQIERLTLVTADRRIAAYDVDVLTP